MVKIPYRLPQGLEEELFERERSGDPDFFKLGTLRFILPYCPHPYDLAFRGRSDGFS